MHMFRIIRIQYRIEKKHNQTYGEKEQAHTPGVGVKPNSNPPHMNAPRPNRNGRKNQEEEGSYARTCR
jgi:hypothetical protein